MDKKSKSCHSCAHEAADPCRSDHRHIPSGENACAGCIRNPYIPKIRRDHFITMNDLRKMIQEDENKRQERERKKAELKKPEVVGFT